MNNLTYTAYTPSAPTRIEIPVALSNGYPTPGNIQSTLTDLYVYYYYDLMTAADVLLFQLDVSYGNAYIYVNYTADNNNLPTPTPQSYNWTGLDLEFNTVVIRSAAVGRYVLCVVASSGYGTELYHYASSFVIE